MATMQTVKMEPWAGGRFFETNKGGIEALQGRQERRARGDKPVPHDAVAQRAVDVITSISVYARDTGSGRAP